MLSLGKYPGGKGRVAHEILPYLPLPRADWYVEPFAGNCPFLQPRYRHYLDPGKVRVWVNDLCFDVYNVIRALQHDPTFVHRMLARCAVCTTCEATKVEFERAKLDLRLDNDPTAYLFLRRLVVNQILLRSRRDLGALSSKYNRPVSEGCTRNGLAPMTRERLTDAVQTAQKLAKVTCWDFRRVLANLPDNAVLYLDPPYWVPESADIYDETFQEQDHHDLAAMLTNLDPRQHRFLLSVEISELSDDLYILPGQFYWTTRPVTYAMTNKQNTRQDEYLIANIPL